MIEEPVDFNYDFFCYCHKFLVFGLPPFRPFILEAFAFFRERILPRATALGFLAFIEFANYRALGYESSMDYEILPYDAPNRWLVKKPDGIAYLVELRPSEGHICSCRAGECGIACKHIKMVEDHVLQVSKLSFSQLIEESRRRLRETGILEDRHMEE